MGFSIELGGDSFRSSRSHSTVSNCFIPKTFIIDFVARILNIKDNSCIEFVRSTKTGTFKVKANIDVLNVVVEKLQLALWENGNFETKVSCENNKVISEYIEDKCLAKAKVDYKEIQVNNLKDKKHSILMEINSIVSKYNIDVSDLNIDIRETVKSL